MQTIRNEYLEVSARKFGAELTSIKNLKTGREYLWQPNKEVWTGQSPILFPIVGRAKNDRLRIDGNEFPIKMHGFARKNEFSINSVSQNHIEYILTNNDELVKSFPYNFELYVRYEITENILKMTFKVKNTDNRTIYFSIGAHPGFNCKLGDRLEFEKNETLCTQVMNDEHYRHTELNYLKNENQITIKADTFANDALIFQNTNSEIITLKAQDNSYSVEFNYKNAPFLGLWAKPGAPYVCIEPWFGADDRSDEDFDFCDKPTVQNIKQGDIFEYTMEITIR